MSNQTLTDVDSVEQPARGRWFKRVRRLALLVLGAYLGVVLLLTFLETYLVYPAPRHPAGDWDAEQWGAQDVNFQSADGTQLHAWLFAHPQPRAHLLFSHGNGENVGYLGEELSQLSDRLQVTILAFDYRGYGKSEGRPFEAGILADAQAASRQLASHANVPVDELILMGRSLGGGVVIDLASKQGARGLILERTFTSLPDIAARIYPWLPVRLVMRNRFESLAKISTYEGPLLQAHGTRDNIVPYELGRKLFDTAAGENKYWVEVPGGGHNDPREPQVVEAIDRFLDTHSAETPESQADPRLR